MLWLIIVELLGFSGQTADSYFERICCCCGWPVIQLRNLSCVQRVYKYKQQDTCIMQAIISLYHSSSFKILSYQQFGCDKTKKKRNTFFELWCKISCREHLPRGPGVCVSDASCGLMYKAGGRLPLGWYQVTLLLHALVLLVLLAFTVAVVVVVVVVVVVPFSHVPEVLSWE